MNATRARTTIRTSSTSSARGPTGAKLNAEVMEAHHSSAVWLLGLTSTRLGRGLEFDPCSERYVDGMQANEDISRNYRDFFVGV